MISDVDESLRRLLTERGNLNSGEVDISFDQPTREWAGGGFEAHGEPLSL